jgi:phosphoribosylformimino-5-aminoimidazole carboxamide ribotide isomerase
MRIIPNLFLDGKHVVSLYRGTENDQKKIYPKAPKSYAGHFAEQGADALFVVDLKGTERARLPELKEAFQGELWWAGQVRDLETLDWLFANGADRVVLGQGAESIFAPALEKFGPEKLLAGLQVFHYDEAPADCERYVKMGFKGIVVKDMNAEGTLFHPNFDLIEKCRYFSGAHIYASGGISEEHHVKLLQDAGAAGALIGRAFFERRLNLGELKARFEHE